LAHSLLIISSANISAYRVLSPELQVGLAPVVSSDAKISASIARYVQRNVPQI
jgi:hypothetical protein